MDIIRIHKYLNVSLPFDGLSFSGEVHINGLTCVELMSSGTPMHKKMNMPAPFDSQPWDSGNGRSSSTPPMEWHMPTPSYPQPWDPGSDLKDRGISSTPSMEIQLLSNILGLMRPTIAAYLSISDEHMDTYFTNVAAGNEGSKLISALNDFIKAGVLAAMTQGEMTPGTKSPEIKTTDNPRPEDQRYFGEQPNEESGKTTFKVHNKRLEVQVSELESMIQRQTRAHVFNNMPIRMLEFDADGSNIKLIGRDEIFRHLIVRVKNEITTPEFQQDWNEALGLQDVNPWFMYRSDRMNELVAKAVSRTSSYAILSHTWIRESPGEVIFSAWDSRKSNHHGWTKLESFCRVAAHDYNMTLGWVDSACINKDSSSELDESIRSMYKWYRSSHICITYMSETEAVGGRSHDSWFTRGWTLQELLAPKNTAFYNQHWHILGTDHDDAIQSWITTETTITNKEMELCRNGKAERIPLGRILQMASRREVTREEDSAYSLLGLLNVNISVAYGEGADVAFRRLCQELLATRKNIFDLFNRQYHYGDSLIPPSLKRYSHRLIDFDDTESTTQLDRYQPLEPVAFTHLGIRCQWLLIPALGFRKGTSAQTYKAKGQYSGQYLSTIVLESGVTLKCVFNLLDVRLYDNSEYVHPLQDVLRTYTLRPVIAVPTFNINEDSIFLPESLMGIDMYTPDRPGTVHSASTMLIMTRNTPIHFTLINSTDGSRNIRIQDLALHGMQLVTLYL